MKLASIETIHSIQPHPNTEVERLEVAKVKEWPVCIPKGQYRDGDLVVFIVIDSVVPDKPEFEFMRKQKFRVWNARFKGAPSSGLVQPLAILPLGKSVMRDDGKGNPIETQAEWEVGDDVSEILGVTKYERPIDVSMGGKQVGHFPTDVISITDEDNALSYPEAFDELHDGQEIYVTLKNDGSSVTYIQNNGTFKACSRRFEMQEGEGFPWIVANKYDLKNKLNILNKNVAIQGEAIGPKLNCNKMKLKDIEFRLFRVKNLDTNTFYNYNELKEFANILNIPIVEELLVCPFNKSIHTIEFFRNIADNVKWPNTGDVAEGIVIAPVVPTWSYTLRKSWSVKIINQNYKQA